MKSTKAAKYVVSQLQSESLSVDHARLLISHLEKQPRIRFSSEDIALGKKALEAKGQVAKAKLLEKLRRKSHAYKRWLQTPLEQLEEEFVHICEDRDHNPAALNTIHEVILNKITSDKVINYVNVEHHLRIIKERNLRNPRIIELAKQMFSSAIRAALLEQKLDIVRKLWEVRISPLSVEDALTYVAMLVLDERLDEADIVSEDLRNSAQTITAGALQIVGDRLENYSDITKMRHLTQYFRSKFNLSPKQLLRIFSPVRLRHLKRLIEEGDLEKASQFMIEETIESNNAFGQYELAAAAIRAGNAGILKSLFDVVKRTHGKEVAFLDLAIIFLEEGRTEQAFKLLDRRQCDVVNVSRSIKDILRVAITGNLDEAIRRYNEFSESNDIPDWGVVKFSSVLVTNGLEEQSEKLLKQYYDEYGGVHRYVDSEKIRIELIDCLARNSSVKEEQVLAALVRVMDNSSKKSFQNALRFYRCLLDGKFCSNKDIYIELFAKQALQNHGVSEAIAELEKLKTFGRVKSLSRTFRLLLLHATKYGTPEEVSQVDVFINATSPLAARRLKGFVNLELGRSALFVESLQYAHIYQGNRLDHNDFSFMVELARKVKSVEVLEGLLHVSAVLLLSSKEKMTIYDELVKIYGKRDDVDNLQRILELVLSEPDKDSFRVTLERIAHFYRCMREDLPQRLQWALQV
ncbi:hypothetical protein DICVIV_00130 [Dictyocaulus viviparus]|uniref:Uncharacterized protein n=1 Tax=Dictyocaulus viviparus TaxID=29172 RepID=A0A0D8YG98_DICVI|nr:hypothetical protein DICVIV_00130 [Dictyocaulus viviparus]